MRKVLFILGQLSDDDCEWLVEVGERRVLAPGHVLIREEGAIDAIYFVLDGHLSVTAEAARGREVARLASGEIVGEMSFVDASPPSATVTATERAEVLAIPRSALSEKIESDSEFAARFYRATSVFLADRVRSTVRKFGYGDLNEPDEQMDSADELSPQVLDTASLAGSRFQRMLALAKEKATEDDDGGEDEER